MVKEINENTNKTDKAQTHSNSDKVNHKKIDKKKNRPSVYDNIHKLLKIKKIADTTAETDQPTLFTQYKYDQLKSMNKHLKKSLEKLKYERMTKIQVKSYLPITRREDCVLKSETGSGKTLAYFAPILNSLMNEEKRIVRSDGIRVLVVVPTRELGLQIQKLIERVSRCCVNIVSCALVGGNGMDSEKTSIRKGLNVVVGTPARLVYHLRSTARFSLNSLTTLVFEECDRTLDMGFKRDIGLILEKVEERKNSIHKIFVSACLSENVENLLYEISSKKEKKIENMYKFIGFNDNLRIHSSPETLSHFFMMIDERKKVTAFLTLLKVLEHEKLIVFVSTADQANFLERICALFDKPDYGAESYHNQHEQTKPTQYVQDKDELLKFDVENLGDEIDEKVAMELMKNQQKEEVEEVVKEVKIHNMNAPNKFLQTAVYKIHGYMNQKDRTNVFNNFHECKKGVLICTDIGSRGLDFTGTNVIILFDVSPSYKDYINRVGRTARIGQEGTAISFLYDKERSYSNKLKENCKAEELQFERIEDSFRAIVKPEIKSFGQSLDFQMRKCIDTYQLGNLSRRAFVSFCRAYSRLKDTESFNLKKLNLAGVSKSYGCRSTKATDETGKVAYGALPDAKQLNSSELAFLDRKRNATIKGINDIKSRRFEKMEFE